MLYTPTTNDIDKMNRTDLVFEMSKHAHIDHYHKIIKWNTEMIRTMLHWYKNTPKQKDMIVRKFARNEIDTIRAIQRRMYLQGITGVTFMGLDFGKGESKTFTHTFKIKNNE